MNTPLRIPPYQLNPNGPAQGTPFTYQQHWLPQQEKDFRPAHSFVSWSPHGFHIHASLTNLNPQNRAVKDHEMLCELGDVFEVFLQDTRSERYFEIHISPENKKLVLEFPQIGFVRTPEFQTQWEKNVVHESNIIHRTRLLKEQNKWEVDLFVPFLLLTTEGAPKVGDLWKISMGRYDCSILEAPPVISSTSRHAICDFHRVDEWDLIQLQ